MEIEILFVALVIGLFPAAIAKTKGRSFLLWWLYGTGLFIVAIIHALAIKPLEGYGVKKCPFYAELIKEKARACRYCSRDLPATHLPTATTAQERQSSVQDPKQHFLTQGEALIEARRQWGESTEVWVNLGFQACIGVRKPSTGRRKLLGKGPTWERALANATRNS